MANYTLNLEIDAKVLASQPTDNLCIAKKGTSVIMNYLKI